jgi:hypothetical protein
LRQAGSIPAFSSPWPHLGAGLCPVADVQRGKRFGPFAFQQLAPHTPSTTGPRSGEWAEHGLLGRTEFSNALGPLAAARPRPSCWDDSTALIVNGKDGPAGYAARRHLGFVSSAPRASPVGGVLALRRRAPFATGQPFGAAYGIYFVHYVFVIWLQYVLLGVPLFAIAKAAIVFTGALMLSWAAAAAVCRIPIGARLMGGKRRELAQVP